MSKNWYALSWHAHDWEILEWDVESFDTCMQDPRLGPDARNAIENGIDVYDQDNGGYIAVNENVDLNYEVYPGFLGEDDAAFLTPIEDIYYMQITGPFPNAYTAQYYIDGRVLEEEDY